MPTLIPLVPAPAAPPVWLPGVSVIVATRDDETSIGRCLASLRALAYPILETIVVDRGSRDATVATATAAGARVLPAPGADAALARNCAVGESTHDIVAFTGADCVVPAKWLETLVDGLRRSKAAGAGGDLALAIASREPGDPLAIEAEAIAALVELAARVRGYVREADGDGDVDHNPADNVAYIRHAFREAGGYADGLWPAADVDLDFRLRGLGYRCHRVAGAVVRRHHPGTLAALAADLRAEGRAHRAIVARHGRLRPLHFAPLALAALALAQGLLIPRRTRTAVLAMDAIALGSGLALVAGSVPPRLWGPVLRCAAAGALAWHRGYAEGTPA